MSNSIQRAEKRKLGIFLPFFLLLLLGCLCQYDPYADRFTTQRPNPTDVEGTYILKEQTLTKDGLRILPGKKCLIEIRTNRKFTATDFPIWKETGPIGYELDKFVSPAGKWEIEIVGGVSKGRDVVTTQALHKPNTSPTIFYCQSYISEL